MKTVAFVQEGLGNSSYIIDLGNGNAVAVDPDRSVDRYLDYLRRAGLRLSAIFETHLHADFITGARDLASNTAAPVFISRGAESKLPVNAVGGGERLEIDGCEATAIGSPGHTPEHLSFVFRGASGPPLLFSGGSLIVGGAARTDLISPAMTDALTRGQFRTLQHAFSELPDETLLYPTHGGGSFCSTGAGQERTSTLGRERRENPLLSLTDEEEFAVWFPTTFPSVPDYFYRLRAVNQAGPRLRAQVSAPRALEPDEFAGLIPGSVVVDVRSKEDYANGHIPGSLSIPMRNDYAVWLGWLVPANARLLFVTEEASLGRLVDDSLLVGYEDLAGWLRAGIQAWQASGSELRRFELVDAETARRALAEGAASLDVREPDEYRAGHLPGAVHVPLGRLGQEIAAVPGDRPVVVYCGHGERASTGASLLEAAGYGQLLNLDGGVGAWRAAGFAISSEPGT